MKFTYYCKKNNIEMSEDPKIYGFKLCPECKRWHNDNSVKCWSCRNININGICKICGKPFIIHKNGASTKFCSKECRDKNNETRFKGRTNYKNTEWYKRQKVRNKGHVNDRFTKDKIIDKDITWQKIIKRDGNICAICGLKVNADDYAINEKGYFCVGALYPSIDHIIPRTKGGFHSWDNVQLAHFKCNSIKRDRL